MTLLILPVKKVAIDGSVHPEVDTGQVSLQEAHWPDFAGNESVLGIN